VSSNEADISPSSKISGRIFDIQFFSIHDGPGIRTTVFLKGCPLNCRWCHNPESIGREAEIGFSPGKCIGCGACVDECPQDAHRFEGEIHVYDRSLCQLCGRCVDVCDTMALEVAGREITVAEVIDEVLKDSAFYETSGGGITLSGGEPFWQPEFALAVLRAAREAGLNTCLDTSGYAPWNVVEDFPALVDLFLYDIKCLDGDLHKELTGVSNALILSNLQKLDESGAKFMIRVPFVPGLNIHEGFGEELARLYGSLDNCQGVQILPYHELAKSKYERFSKPFSVEGIKSPTDEVVEEFVDRMRELGVETERG